MSLRRMLLAAALLCSAAAGAFAAPKIDVSLAPTEVTIGDRIEMIVTVRADASDGKGIVRFQDWGDSLGPAEILEVGAVEKIPASSRAEVYRQRIVLALFQLGEVTLPPVEAVVFGPQGETPLTSVSSRVVVRSVLPEGEAEIEAKPPAPPQRPGLGDTFWWSTAVLLATCLVALVVLARRSGSDLEDDEPGRPRLAPIEELRRALAALDGADEVEPIHAEVSLAMRRFLGRVLAFPAAESTTTEVRHELRQRQLSPDLVRRTDGLLTSCDMVMFARRDVEMNKARTRVRDAGEIANGVLDETATALANRTEGDPESSGGTP